MENVSQVNIDAMHIVNNVTSVQLTSHSHFAQKNRVRDEVPHDSWHHRRHFPHWNHASAINGSSLSPYTYPQFTHVSSSPFLLADNGVDVLRGSLVFLLSFPTWHGFLPLFLSSLHVCFFLFFGVFEDFAVFLSNKAFLYDGDVRTAAAWTNFRGC